MANNIKISLDKVIDILNKIKAKVAGPDALPSAIVGYIDGQLDALDALKADDDISLTVKSGEGSRSVLDIADAIPADSTKGVVKLDNEQLNKMIEGMRDAAKPNIVYVPERVVERQPYTSPWWTQLTCSTADNTTSAVNGTGKISLGDLPNSKPSIPQFHGADCRA